MSTPNARTVLITGTSSGIGRDTARAFQARGWNVAATMRKPAAEAELTKLERVRTYPLDVLDESSTRRAIDDAVRDFGGLDMIVNNAGYAMLGSFEAASQEQIQRQFDTNLFGAMRVIRAALPVFRAQRRGTIVNVSSVGGLLTFPLYSLYHATKWALEGFSESLRYELRPLGITVKLIEPGGVRTDFNGRSQDVAAPAGLEDYRRYSDHMVAVYGAMSAAGADPKAVAEALCDAATDGTDTLRYVVPAASPAQQLLQRRTSVPFEQFAAEIERMFGVPSDGA